MLQDDLDALVYESAAILYEVGDQIRAVHVSHLPLSKNIFQRSLPTRLEIVYLLVVGLSKGRLGHLTLDLKQEMAL